MNTPPLPDGLPRFTGKVLVLGSAPGPIPPVDLVDRRLLTVNASQVTAEGWGMPRPDMTLFGTTVLGLRPSNRAAQQVLNRRGTGCLVRMTDGSATFIHDFNLWRMRYVADRVVPLDIPTRRGLIANLVGDAIAQRFKPSNGVYLTALALALGATDVVMAGFSLTVAGHAYNNENHPRHHVDADREVLLALVAAGLAISTTSPDFAASSGLRLAAQD